MKPTIGNLRKKYGLTQRELSEKYDIPLRTIQNWESRQCCPYYVYNLIAKDLSFQKYMDESKCIKGYFRYGGLDEYHLVVECPYT